MLSPLTRRQKELLDYVNMMVGLNGYAPSLQEIRDHFKLKAISTVHEHLENLKNKGYIKKEMNQARGILITNVEELEKFKTVKITTKCVDGKLSNYTGKRENVIVDKNLFDNLKNNAYAIEVNDESLKTKGIKVNDILVVEETEACPKGGLGVIKAGKVRFIDKSRDMEGESIVGRVVCSIRIF